ncbi:MAG TPA: hypothetical protein VN828_07295 [Acidobacteriaceae bacterium]|nr:hypothetical protein [Acidobacteriaceae bacterium]
MEIIINGPGEVLVCFIDPQGRTLLQERLRMCGSDGISARRPVNLSVETRNGHIEVSPVLSSKGERQHVTFDAQEPAKFTMTRCKEIGCNEAVLRAIADGQAQPLPTEPGHTPTQHLPVRPKP